MVLFPLLIIPVTVLSIIEYFTKEKYKNHLKLDIPQIIILPVEVLDMAVSQLEHIQGYLKNIANKMGYEIEWGTCSNTPSFTHNFTNYNTLTIFTEVINEVVLYGIPKTSVDSDIDEMLKSIENNNSLTN